MVYAVGTLNLRSLRRLSAEDFHHDLHVNAVGAALTVQAALPTLKTSVDTALRLCPKRPSESRKLSRGR